MAKNIFTDNLSEPLNQAAAARVDINAGDGNLSIDGLTGGEQVLVNGTLQYLEGQGIPARTLVPSEDGVTFTLKGGRAGQPWFHLPWAACNGATDWQIHLNPAVPSDITAHSDGGNVELNLAGMAVKRLSADTGGGNINLVLPENTTDLSVAVKTGAGNVNVQVPGGIEVKIHATSGLGKVMVDSRFNKIDGETYQSPDYDEAANKVEITAKTGAGNVSVSAG